MSKYEYLRVPKEKSVMEEVLPVDPDLEICPELLSFTAINGNAMHNSASRGVMLSGHWTQAGVIMKGEEDILQTGVANILARNTMGPIVDKDATIVGTVSRYKNISSRYVNKEIEKLIFYITDDGVFDYISVPTYNQGGYSGFGYTYKVDEKKIEEDLYTKRIKAGTRYAVSPTVRENDGYALGLNANMLMCSYPAAAEDAVVISESFAKKAIHERFETKCIDFGSKQLPLNLYGDENNYKPFPEIGELIREDGLLAATRDISDVYTKKREDRLPYTPTLMSNKGLSRVDPDFDKCIYCLNKGEIIKIGDEEYTSGEVVDIICYKNNKKVSDNFDMVTELAEKYSASFKKFNREILDLYYKVVKDYNDGFYYEGGTPLMKSKRLHRLITEVGIFEPEYMLQHIQKTPMLKAMAIENNIARGKKGGAYLPDPTDIRLGNRNNPLDTYRVEIVIRYRYLLGEGNKISDKAGGKGVITSVVPDELMPYNETGRADVIMTSSSVVSRLNMSRMYDPYYGAASRFVQKNLRGMLAKTGKQNVYELSEKELEDMFVYLMGFLGKFDNDQFDTYAESDFETKQEILNDCVTKEVYIFDPVNKRKRAYQIVMDIHESEYNPPLLPVTFPYKDDKGVLREQTSIEPMFISPYHIIMLTITSDQVITNSTPHNNAFNVFVRTTKENRDRLPYNNSPVRSLGETEMRQYACNGSVELASELMDRATSITTHREMVKGILTAQQPTNIENLVDRRNNPLGQSENIKLVKALMATIGFDPVYKDIKS